MALNLKHFDTKTRKDLDVQETIKHSIAEYLFPDTEFALGMVYQEAAIAKDLREYQGKTLQFASGERMYFASQQVRDLLYPNPSDGAAYGSLVFTPNRQFSEQKNLRILIVDDSTGDNGGVLSPDVAKKLVGDCYGKINAELAQEIVEEKNTPFQFRLGIKPQEGNNVHRIGKGTLAPAFLEDLGQPKVEKLPNGETRTKAGFDIVLPTSSFKGRKGEKYQAIELGEYNLTVGIGIKALAEYGKHSLGTQVLVNYPQGVEGDILPELKEEAKKLAAAQSNPQLLAQLYVQQYERRQEFLKPTSDPSTEIEADLSDLGAAIEEAFGDEEVDSPEQKKQDMLLYRVLKADLSGHFQLLEHPKVIEGLNKFVRKEWADIATGRAIKFNSGLAQPSWNLAENEICVPTLPVGEEVIVTRSPLVNSNGVIVLTNKHLPGSKNQQGTIHIHPDTAAKHLQADFDGDRLAFELASNYPTLAAEIKEYNQEQNRYPDVVKRAKEAYTGSFEEIALSAMENKIGIIANQIQKAVALQWETQLIPTENKSAYLNQISYKYKRLIKDNANPAKEVQLPPQFQARVEKLANLPRQLSPIQIEQSLGEVKKLLFDTVSELSNELQVAVDGPKSAARPNESVLNYCKAISDYTPVEWLADKKKPEAFLNRPMKSTNYSPIDLMVQQTNHLFTQSQLTARPTLDFKPLFQGVSFTAEQEAEAKAITKTYNPLIKEALLLKEKAKQKLGPSLIATSSISGKEIEITHLLKFDPTNSPVWTGSQLDIKLFENNDTSLPSPLKAVVVSDSQGNPCEQTIGIVSPESIREHDLKKGMKLAGATVTLTPGATSQQVDAKFTEAAQYLDSVRQNTPEAEQLPLAAALWSVNHARSENQNLKKASVAFNAFPEQLIGQLSEFQFGNLTVVGVHQSSNEHSGRRWKGEKVQCAIALETDQNSPNYGRRIVTVEGKKLAPLRSESPVLPVGTKFEAEIISPLGAGAIATTQKGNSLKVTQIKNYDFAGREWNGESTQIQLGVARSNDSRGDRNAIAALVGGKILGILDKESVEKLKAAQLLKPGVTINANLQTTVSTIASVKVDPKTVEYPNLSAVTQSTAGTDVAREPVQNTILQPEFPFQPPVPFILISDKDVRSLVTDRFSLFDTGASESLYGYCNNDQCRTYKPVSEELLSIIQYAKTQGLAYCCEMLEQENVRQHILSIDFPDRESLVKFERDCCPLPMQSRYQGVLSGAVQFIEAAIVEEMLLDDTKLVPEPSQQARWLKDSSFVVESSSRFLSKVESVSFTTGNHSFAVFSDLMVLDVDTTDRVIAKQNLQSYCDQNPEQLWAVHQTKNGLHAMRLDAPVTPATADVGLVEALGVDRKYWSMCLANNAWSARVTKKESRQDDRISLKKLLGTGVPDPKLLRQALAYQETLIINDLDVPESLDLLAHALRQTTVTTTAEVKVYPKTSDQQQINSSLPHEETPPAFVTQSITKINGATEPVQPTTIKSDLDRWSAIAQALGRPEKYIQRLETVQAEVKGGATLSEQVRTAMAQDFGQWQQINATLAKWQEAAKFLGKSETYQRRLAEVTFDFNREHQPTPLPKKAVTAMHEALNEYQQNQLKTITSTIKQLSQSVKPDSPQQSAPLEQEQATSFTKLAVESAKNILSNLKSDTYASSDYHFAQKGTTVVIVARDGRGEIARGVNGTVTGIASSSDASQIERLSKAMQSEQALVHQQYQGLDLREY